MAIIRSAQLAFAAAALIAAAALLPLIEANGTEMRIELGKGSQSEFDYFNFALYWAPTYCNGSTSTYCCSENACCRGSNSPSAFTIHGFWPDYDNGKWPSCCTDDRFDENEISTLSDSLEKYWPALSCSKPQSCDGTRGSFWSSAWEKHGTCASSVLADQYSYFSTALNLYFKYNATKVLNEAGFVPSNTKKYPLKDIVSAIEDAFGAAPRVSCTKKSLVQLYLCFNKNFTPQNCTSKGSSCPAKILIPAYATAGNNTGAPEISSA